MEQHRTMGDALNEATREWKKGNPDWQTYLEHPPSPNDPERIRRRRQEIYQGIASLPIAGLQRRLNEHGLPHNPTQTHWERFAISEMQTMQQHARGQHLPFHEDMENLLAHLLKTLDSHFEYRGADGILYVKGHVENWFDSNIRQPARAAFSNVQRQQKRT